MNILNKLHARGASEYATVFHKLASEKLVKYYHKSSFENSRFRGVKKGQTGRIGGIKRASINFYQISSFTLINPSLLYIIYIILYIYIYIRGMEGIQYIENRKRGYLRKYTTWKITLSTHGVRI